MASQIISTRLKALRQERGLSQKGMARVFGFKDRQTVSAIENGVRRVTAAELLLAVEKFGVPLDYFTDPFRLDGKGLFSWRQRGVGREVLRNFEQTAGCWIGAYRTLGAAVGRPSPLMRNTLGLTKVSRFDDAVEAGERFAVEFKLGDVPASRLAEAMQERLGILVLAVDAYKGISGAACRLPDLDTVLVVRDEVVGRRNFDLAHELFHILTWDAMPPEHIEDATDFGGNRVEQLADNFAAALLMPRTVVVSFADWQLLEGDALIARLNDAANQLRVTSSALRWRLVCLGHITKATARAIPEAELRNNGRESTEEQPPLFSRSFANVVATAIDQGLISVRRAAILLGLTIEDLEELFSAHAIEYALNL